MGDLWDELRQRCRCGHVVHSHSHGSGPCDACKCKRFAAPPRRKPAPRPTVLTMDGETTSTGEEPCRVKDDADWKGCRAAMATCGPDGTAYFDDHTKCPAPTPRAKP